MRLPLLLAANLLVRLAVAARPIELLDGLRIPDDAYPSLTLARNLAQERVEQRDALGYFADKLKVVNLDGVVNKACYQSLVERRNMDYIRRVGVQYVVGWPENIEFIKRHSTGFREDDLRLVRKIEGFRSWERVVPLPRRIERISCTTPSVGDARRTQEPEERARRLSPMYPV